MEGKVMCWGILAATGMEKQKKGKTTNIFFGQGEPSLITRATPNPTISVSSEGDIHMSPVYKVFLGQS